MTQTKKILNQLKELSEQNRFPQILYLICHTKYDELLNEICKLLKIKVVDRLKVELEEDKKSIGIGQMKKFKNQIMTSALGNNKIGIILKADLLTEEAANSILKLIEDLPKQTYIIFIAETDKLIATLRSRISRTFYIDEGFDNDGFLLEKKFLDEMSLSEKLIWFEKENSKIDLKQFIKNIVYLTKNDRFNNTLKESLLDMLTFLEANVNKKLIFDYLAIVTSKNS